MTENECWASGWIISMNHSVLFVFGVLEMQVTNYDERGSVCNDAENVSEENSVVCCWMKNL